MHLDPISNSFASVIKNASGTGSVIAENKNECEEKKLVFPDLFADMLTQCIHAPKSRLVKVFHLYGSERNSVQWTVNIVRKEIESI